MLQGKNLQERESWRSNAGFILVVVGNAIGVGNVWLFPWRVGAYGGAAFLIIYLFMIFVIASTGLVEEFALGRRYQRGAMGAYAGVLGEKKENLRGFGAFLGFLPTIAVYGVLVFYLIVVGWVFKYFVLSLGGLFSKIDVPAFFGSFVGSTATLPWHIIAVVITALIVALGVQKGLERSAKIMLPALLVLMLILLIRSLTLPGAGAGVRFLLVPDWSKALQPITWVMALGQAFFSVSLAGAGNVVLGSYLKKAEDLPKAAFRTAGLDTVGALLAAFIVIPAAFAFGVEPGAGPGLIFVTLPSIFPEMPGGLVFGPVFFLCLILVVISSSIALFEVPVEALMDRFKLRRPVAVAVTAVVTWGLGLPLALNMGVFGTWITAVTVYMAPFGAVLAGIMFFWVLGPKKAQEEIRQGLTSKTFGKRWFVQFGKYVFVGVSILVLVLGIVFGGIG